MTTSRRFLASAFLALAASGAMAQAPPEALRVRTTTRGPDEFGVQDYSVTVIPGAAFTTGSVTRTTEGDLFRDFNGNSGHLFAGVNIPSGAVIDFVGLESATFQGGTVVATLFQMYPNGGTGSIVSVPNSAHAVPYYDTDYNATALGWQLAANVGQALVVDVYFPGGEGGLGWVEIWWKRAVSPPPASPTFADVPPSDFGYQYIEALAASGITGGCGGGNYCPDANLTRRQMAIFLAKALGLHWPY